MSFLSEARLQDRFEPFVAFQDAPGSSPISFQKRKTLFASRH